MHLLAGFHEGLGRRAFGLRTLGHIVARMAAILRVSWHHESGEKGCGKGHGFDRHGLSFLCLTESVRESLNLPVRHGEGAAVAVEHYL